MSCLRFDIEESEYRMENWDLYVWEELFYKKRGQSRWLLGLLKYESILFLDDVPWILGGNLPCETGWS